MGLIALQSFPDHWWGKLDLKIPFDWENDDEIPASAEVQIGKMLTPKFAHLKCIKIFINPS